MKIFCWNVNPSNSLIKNGVNWIISQNPDVVCLQEVPKYYLQALLSSIASPFVVSYALDYQNASDNRKDTYIVTIIKSQPISTKIIQYNDKNPSSLVAKVLHHRLSKTHKQHLGLSTLVHWPTKNISLNIINLHLSCSIGFRDRLAELQDTLKQVDNQHLQVVGGDLNIIRNKIVKTIVGKVSGYSSEELRINEEDEFTQLIDQYHLKNIFSRTCTMSSAWLRPFSLQLDHILLDKQINEHQKKICDGFGSDHRILHVCLEQDLNYE